MNSEAAYILFLLLLFAVAFLYASVGHGGASGYLALMAIFGMAPGTMRSSALLMNVIVSLVSFVHYYRSGNFKPGIFIPFAIASVPASFLGAITPVDTHLYNKILGVLLLFPILRLSGVFGSESAEIKPVNKTAAALIGLSIGFLSGMIGIGGGILLSPVLLLLHWADMKQTAAVSALFIFVNSASGLLGMLSGGAAVEHAALLWIGISLAGGYAGAYWGAQKLKNTALKKILGLVLLFASFKLLFTQPK